MDHTALSASTSFSYGYNQSGPSPVPEAYLNRWSRYLSRGYYSSSGAAAWSFLSISEWIADRYQFAPNVPLPKLPFTWPSVYDQGTCSEWRPLFPHSDVRR